MRVWKRIVNLLSLCNAVIVMHGGTCAWFWKSIELIMLRLLIVFGSVTCSAVGLPKGLPPIIIIIIMINML